MAMRWAVLGVYIILLGMSQLLWLNFAPILTLVEARYQVSELTASALVLVFPFLYVVLSLPAGRLIDTRGYRPIIGAGAAVMAAFAALRIWDTSFAVLLVAQLGIAVAQPFIVNGVSKLVVDWFEPDQRAIATGLATMGMFLGMAAGLATTPPLVAAHGLRGAMIVLATVTAASSLAFWLVARPNPAAPPAIDASGAARELAALVRDRKLLVVFALALLGLGAFNGLTTWLEQILAPQGFDPEQAGAVGGVLILGGIVGAVIIPLLSDRLRRRKPFVIACAAGGLATLYPMCATDRHAVAMLFAALHGFFLLPAFALLLDMSAQLAGPERAGSATAILMLVGNAGGVAVPVAMQAVKGSARTFRPAIYLLLVLLAAILALALVVTETRERA